MINPYPSFSTLLKSQRDALNARFTLRIRSGVRIDGDAFLAHLSARAAPLVESVQAEWPERAPAVLTALYDASLDLFAASLLGPDARIPGIDRVWTDVLTRNIRLLAREPVGLSGSLSNAAFQVALQCGKGLELWVNRMREVLPQCDSLSRVLELGQVVAWQAGMPQYRQAALEVAVRLPAKLAAQSLGMPAETTQGNLLVAVDRLRANPWLTAEGAIRPGRTLTQLACVGTAGSFTGFGGVFSRPPIVSCADSRIMVSSGSQTWQVLADAYGTWFRRIPEQKVSTSTLPTGITVDRRGNLQWGPFSLSVPYLAGATSTACDGVTLAITIPTSHHLFLFARAGASL